MNTLTVSPTLRRHESEPAGGGSSEGLRAKASELKRQAGDAVRATAGQIKSTASDATDEIKEQAAGMIDDRKEQAAGMVDDYGSAVHAAADSLERDDPNIAWLAHNAADRVQRVADYLRRSDFSTLRRDVEDLARRNPVVFFGGLFVAGLVLGNLVKATAGGVSSSDSDSDDTSDRETGSQRGRERTSGERAGGEDAFAGYRSSSDAPSGPPAGDNLPLSTLNKPSPPPSGVTTPAM